jgi:hypothetical protein
MGQIESDVAKECSVQGLKAVIIGGRSAGGTGALALTDALNITDAEILPAIGVYAAEPAGMYETDVKSGKQDYRSYLRNQKASLQEATGDELVKPHGSGVHGLGIVTRAASIVFSNINDIYTNDAVWKQPVALESALRVASNQPSVHMQLDFAATSMTAPDFVLKYLEAELPARRGNDPSAAPVNVYRVPRTVHASFDNRKFYAERNQILVDQILATY